MQEKQHGQLGFVQSVLPWFVAAGALLIYLLTLNHWVSLNSLPYVAKVTGWDWSLPLQAPLFFLLTFPVRGLPSGWQPLALNAFAAVCAALTLALLARSVALLPHDRTLAQRQRERNEFSFLSIPAAWLPPLFAALVCGLQLTFWENATAATNEALDLLLFAYVTRCLLEFRVSQRDSWLFRLALAYGLGVTNNWALIGFFPCFLIALIWIKGSGFFQAAFMVRMLAMGFAGLMLYLLLPILWAMSDVSSVDFAQALRAQLANQKGFLFDTPQLRNRAFVLSLTSILPVFIMGIRWPSSFGDTSAAGAALTNLMFRIIHLVFLAACLWVVFDQKFSPRALVTYSLGLSFLTFYYLGALAVGYYSGYALLVFGEAKSSKSWRRRSEGGLIFDRVMTALVWLAFAGVTGGLLYKNFRTVRHNDGTVLRELAGQLAKPLPASGALVLSDDLRSLTLVEAHFSGIGSPNKHLLIHSRSLPIPEYHRQIAKRYPQRWPNIVEGIPEGETVEDEALLRLMMALGQTNDIYYLHPSFGFYFEHFYARADGLAYHLTPYPTNMIFPPAMSPAEFEKNQSYWSQRAPGLQPLQISSTHESLDNLFAAQNYSRALNFWAVELQKSQHLKEAGPWFKAATELNTNNRPALVNLELNTALQSGAARARETFKSIDEKFGLYRTWDRILVENGPFDHPDFCFLLGTIFAQQNLFREAALQYHRVETLEPTNLLARLALADVYLQGTLPDKTLETVAAIRSIKPAMPLQPEDEFELIRLEAAAYFAKANHAQAEKILLDAQAKYPDRVPVLDMLVMYYGKTARLTNALETINRILKVSPENPQALRNQATLYFNHTNFPLAVTSLDRVLQKDPKNVPALLYRVFMLTEIKDYKKAMEDVERALEIEPDNQEALLYKGAISIETKQYAEAIPPLNRLLVAQPTSWKALRNRAIANLHLGNLQIARADYEKLRKQLPRYYIAYYGLGEIAYRRKNVPTAIKYYELYLKYVPNVDTPEMAAEKKMVEERLKDLKAARL